MSERIKWLLLPVTITAIIIRKLTIWLINGVLNTLIKWFFAILSIIIIVSIILMIYGINPIELFKAIVG